MNGPTTEQRDEVSHKAEEEPPGTSTAQSAGIDKHGHVVTKGGKNGFFSHIPEDKWKDWKWQFRNRITTVEELSGFIPLSSKEAARIRLTAARFPLSITPYYLSLVDPLDPTDPIRKQAIPCFDELAFGCIGNEDPLDESHDSVVPGLVHRYPDRVLMVLTNMCPMLCRHCTRKRQWQKSGWVRTPLEIDGMLTYIHRNTQVRDVVISGGDPLTLSTGRLEEVISRLRRIEHVEIIRIGTRFPVVLPQRVDQELCAMLSKYGPIWLNTQFNHAREITAEAAQACDRLLRAGVPVSNQSVLLLGVNDTVEAQTSLCQGLLKIKVRPYYLYQCDEVQGTEHLRTPAGTGVKIIEGMRGHTSGLAIPSFVIDLPHGGGKVPLQPNYVLMQTEEELVLRNYEHEVFRYRNPAVLTRRKNGHSNGRRVRDSAREPVAGDQAAKVTLGEKDESRDLVRP